MIPRTANRLGLRPGTIPPICQHHRYEIVDGGFADKYTFGHRSRSQQVCNNAGVRCSSCGRRTRIPFERAALLPFVDRYFAPAVWVQAWPIAGGPPRPIDARLELLPIDWREQALA